MELVRRKFVAICNQRERIQFVSEQDRGSTRLLVQYTVLLAILINILSCQVFSDRE